jgi:hypothetical protein
VQAVISVGTAQVYPMRVAAREALRRRPILLAHEGFSAR